MSREYGQHERERSVVDRVDLPLVRSWCEPHNRWEIDCTKCTATDVGFSHECEWLDTDWEV